MASLIQKLISGGQTGVDRGALDVAIQLNIPHGGWCPRDRRAEDGQIPRQYQLTETELADYKERTERNVIDSDATLILVRGPLSGGTFMTHAFATDHGKPLHVVDLYALTSGQSRSASLQQARQWIQQTDVDVLNVAGPRESQNEGIAAEAAAYLVSLLNGNGNGKHS
ncbi:MAG: putative molybdenum carrier protein [Pirellulales bacterium]